MPVVAVGLRAARKSKEAAKLQKFQGLGPVQAGWGAGAASWQALCHHQWSRQAAGTIRVGQIVRAALQHTFHQKMGGPILKTSQVASACAPGRICHDRFGLGTLYFLAGFFGRLTQHQRSGLMRVLDFFLNPGNPFGIHFCQRGMMLSRSLVLDPRQVGLFQVFDGSADMGLGAGAK